MEKSTCSLIVDSTKNICKNSVLCGLTFPLACKYIYFVPKKNVLYTTSVWIAKIAVPIIFSILAIILASGFVAFGTFVCPSLLFNKVFFITRTFPLKLVFKFFLFKILLFVLKVAFVPIFSLPAGLFVLLITPIANLFSYININEKFPVQESLYKRWNRAGDFTKKCLQKPWFGIFVYPLECVLPIFDAIHFYKNDNKKIVGHMFVGNKNERKKSIETQTDSASKKI